MSGYKVWIFDQSLWLVQSTMKYSTLWKWQIWKERIEFYHQCLNNRENLLYLGKALSFKSYTKPSLYFSIFLLCSQMKRMRLVTLLGQKGKAISWNWTDDQRNVFKNNNTKWRSAIKSVHKLAAASCHDSMTHCKAEKRQKINKELLKKIWTSKIYNKHLNFHSKCRYKTIDVRYTT